MKNSIGILFLAGLIFGCAKPDISIPESVAVDLAITQASAPATVQRYTPITVQLRLSAPNQCYQFTGFQVYQPNPVTFEIAARGIMPNPDRNPVCAPQVYTKDTVLQLPTQFAGKHALRYYNNGQIFRVDTVNVVN